MNEKPFPTALTYFRNIHLLLGSLACIPILMWCVSGFFLAMPPGAVKGEPFRAVEMAKVTLSPAEAIARLNVELDEPFEPTAVTLEQRGENPRFTVFAKGKTYHIDARSGLVKEVSPPSGLKRWVRNAHFFNFAGHNRTFFLLNFSGVAAFSTLSGLVLLVFWLWRRIRSC